MCLVSQLKEPFIADENIECYKIFIPKDGFYITPYKEFSMMTNIEIEDPNDESFTHVFGVTLVESGYFHSCLNQKGILKVVSDLKRKLPKGTSVKILKAIIPKGTKYFLGQDNDICSKKLILYENNQRF